MPTGQSETPTYTPSDAPTQMPTGQCSCRWKMETPPIRKIIPKSLDNPDDCKGTKRVSHTEGDLEVGDTFGSFWMKGEGNAADNCKNYDAEVDNANSHKK